MCVCFPGPFCCTWIISTAVSCRSTRGGCIYLPVAGGVGVRPKLIQLSTYSIIAPSWTLPLPLMSAPKIWLRLRCPVKLVSFLSNRNRNQKKFRNYPKQKNLFRFFRNVPKLIHFGSFGFWFNHKIIERTEIARRQRCRSMSIVNIVTTAKTFPYKMS
jgi:hypothetical protein